MNDGRSSEFDQMVWIGPGQKVRLGDITMEMMVDLLPAQETEEAREGLRMVAAALLGHQNLEAQQRAAEQENLRRDD